MSLPIKEKLCTVLTVWLPHEAHLAKAKLLSEGIECFVADDNLVSINPFYANAIGGVKLKVWEGDVKEALELLKGFGSDG